MMKCDDDFKEAPFPFRLFDYSIDLAVLIALMLSPTSSNRGRPGEEHHDRPRPLGLDRLIDPVITRSGDFQPGTAYGMNKGNPPGVTDCVDHRWLLQGQQAGRQAVIRWTRSNTSSFIIGRECPTRRSRPTTGVHENNPGCDPVPGRLERRRDDSGVCQLPMSRRAGS